MKISVKLEASENYGQITLYLDDLCLTQEEWEQMTDSEKHGTIEKAVAELPEHRQPYWMVGSFKTKD